MVIKANDGMILYITTADKLVDQKAIKASIGLTGKTRFATTEEMCCLLCVPKGCASVFALMNTKPDQCRLVLDGDLENEEFLNFHPLRNDATTTISRKDLHAFVDHLKFEITYAHQIEPCES